MKTALIVKVLNDSMSVYKLTPAYTGWNGDENHEFVVASCATQGHPREVLVFPSDGEGIASYSEVGGSYDEPNGHVSALKDMGYTVVKAVQDLSLTPQAEGWLALGS